MPQKSQVLINGVDVGNYLVSWEIFDRLDEIMTQAEIILTKNVIDVVDVSEGHTIVIKRGPTTGQENFMFQGIVEKKVKEHPFLTVSGKDKLYAMRQQEITNSFDKNIDTEAGVPSELFLTLINTYTTGLTATSATVQDSSSLESGIVSNKFVCNHDNLYDRANYLAEILDWQFYYNPTTDLVYLEPKGYTQYDTTLVTGTHLIGDAPKWEFDNVLCVNKVTILGARQLVETTETFSGDTSETEFQLAYVPESIKVYIDSVLKTGGIERSTTTFDYSVDINPDVRKVIFESAPGSGTDNIEVRYSYSIPIPITGENNESIEKYGIYEKTFVYEDIKDVDDAEERARQILGKYSKPFAKVRLKIIGVDDIKAGYLVSVQDNLNNENRTLVAKEVIYRYPYDGDEILLSDKEWRLETWLISIEDRLKKIEREQTRNQEQLIHMRDMFHTMDYNKRYSIIYTRDTTNDSIWGRAGNNWGTAVWQGSYTESLVKERIIWPDQIVKETFYDNDFNDENITNANLSTSEQRVSID